MDMYDFALVVTGYSAQATLHVMSGVAPTVLVALLHERLTTAVEDITAAQDATWL